jgi:hypothetical protein
MYASAEWAARRAAPSTARGVLVLETSSSVPSPARRAAVPYSVLCNTDYCIGTVQYS